jgi:hypothetical protein
MIRKAGRSFGQEAGQGVERFNTPCAWVARDQVLNGSTPALLEESE